MPGPMPSYEAMLMRGEITHDPFQAEAIDLLQDMHERLKARHLSANTLLSTLSKIPAFAGMTGRGYVKGAYFYGGVGRGKSMVMDLFFDAVKPHVKARRLHFHEFMLETHDWLHAVRGDKMDDLLPRYAKSVAKTTDVLCFDEFHVTDVADAMILSRLFGALFERGITVVATSNWPPERLYEGGLQRDLFLPFIALLQDHMNVLHLDNETDYRAQVETDLQTYFYPLGVATDRKMDRIFAEMSAGADIEPKVITVKGRDIVVPAAGGVARFGFAELCERPHGAEDFLKIADAFQTLFLEHVPRMGYDRRNEIKRFMTLIDVLYDKSRGVVISAETSPEKLCFDKDYAFEFERTISRLNEMRSSSYAGNVEENIVD